jgi:hypothetical protein
LSISRCSVSVLGNIYTLVLAMLQLFFREIREETSGNLSYKYS